MARRERPIDPTAGPLPRFAHELRELRAAAGNPTYRAMARQAGFSATTLSEAAAGRRRPSLDVVLAYVGACGGDPDEWRARWQRLDAEPCPTTPVAPAPAAPDPAPNGDVAPTEAPLPEVPAHDPAGVGPHQPTAPVAAAEAATTRTTSDRRWRHRRHLVTAAAVVATIAAAGAAVVAMREASAEDAGPTRAPSVGDAPSTATGCPAAGTAPAAFTGMTYSGTTRIRTAASLDAPVLMNVPVNCHLSFTGFCLGAKVLDQTAGSPDVRWFMVAGGGVVASAVVHGNPPAGTGPSPCPGGRPAPNSIRLTAVPHGTDLQLLATGTHLDIVGFAARYPTDPALPDGADWHQVAMTQMTGGGFAATWQPGRLPLPLRSGTPVLLAAVACLGGDGPTQVFTAGRVAGGRFTGLPAAGLSTTERADAARAACRYPDA